MLHISQMHGQTVFDIAVLVMVVMTVVVLAAWRFNRDVPGLRDWALACVAGIVLMFLIAIRARMPELLAVLATNLAVVAVGYLALTGCQRYVGHRAFRGRLALILAGVVLAISTWFTVFRPDPVIRLVVSGGIGGVFYLLGAHVIATGGLTRYPARYLFALALGLHGSFVFFRPWLLMASNVGTAPGAKLVVPVFVVLESMIFFMLLVVGVGMLVNERMASQLRLMADKDALTNVFNRRAFMVMLDKACSLAKRLDTSLVVMVIDLDHFKQINDRWGHKAGDDVLRSFANGVMAKLRNEDGLGRLGGEEFCIYLPNLGLEDAKEVADRLRACAQADGVVSGECAVHYTVSIGVAQWEPDEHPQAVIHRADQAMYRAKRSGRNQVALAPSESAVMSVVTTARKRLGT